MSFLFQFNSRSRLPSVETQPTPKMALLFALSLLPSLALAGPVAGKTYTISPASYTDLCLAPSTTDEGTGLVVKTCDTSSDIVFTLDGQSIKNTATSMCVDIRDGGVWSGNLAQFWQCYSWNGNQMFDYSGNTIVWSGTELCLDLKDGLGQDGNPVQIWQCYEGNLNQQWVFQEAQEVDDDCDGECNGSRIHPFCLTRYLWIDTTTSAASVATTTAVSASATDAASTASASATSSSTDDVPYCDDDDDEDADDSTSSVCSSTTVSASASATDAASATVTVTDSASASVTAAPSDSNSTSVIGGGLFAPGSSSSSRKHGDHSSSASATESASSSSSDSWASASETASASSSSNSSESSSDSWSASATASVSASVTSSISSASAATSSAASSSGSTDTSGYLKCSGWQVVDPSGNNVVLKGVNVGGWLVNEDWMNGITDNANPDRFAQVTLESRFGESATKTLYNAWYDNYFTSSDWDNIKAMGYNHVRIPFGFRNVQNADGSWRSDAFDRLDWAIAQAKQRSIYVILVFHIWDTQQQSYSMISEDSSDGQSSRDRAGEIWKKVAAHFKGESIIAGFDAINEPTGSSGDKLQQDLYTAIRSADADRIIIMESINTNPANYGWTNVMYSMHEYLMMTDDYQTNINNYYGSGMYGGGGTNDLITQWKAWGVPIYAGEFMAMSSTLPWLLNQLNSAGVWWASWSYGTINMGGWGLYNYPSSDRIDINSASYDDILNLWSNLGSSSRNDDIYSVYTAALGGTSSKRDSVDYVPDFDLETSNSTSVDQAVIGIEQAGILIKTTRRDTASAVAKRASPAANPHKRMPTGHRRSRRHTAGVAGATAF